jgi:hypothetical protein
MARHQQLRSVVNKTEVAKKLFDLRSQTASFEPSVKNFKDAEKIFDLSRQFNTFSSINAVQGFPLGQ